jgi:hypothetical protein
MKKVSITDINVKVKKFCIDNLVVLYNQDFYYFNKAKNRYLKFNIDRIFSSMVKKYDWELSTSTYNLFSQVMTGRSEHYDELTVPIIFQKNAQVFEAGKFRNIKEFEFTTNYIDRKIEILTVEKVEKDFYNVEKHNDILDFFYKFFSADFELFQSLFSALVQPFVGNLSHFISLWGTGINGKGSFNKLLEKTFGGLNVSRVNLDNISDNTIASALDNKLFNISNELSYKGFQSETIKNITTGENLLINQKYGKEPKVVVIKGVQVISSNKVMQTPDKTKALYDRMLPFMLSNHFTRDLSGAKKEQQMFSEKNLDYFASLIVSFGVRVYESAGGVFISQKQKFQISELILDEDILEEYITDNPITPGTATNYILQSLKDLYNVNWSHAGLRKALKEKGFKIVRSKKANQLIGGVMRTYEVRERVY